MRLADGRVLSNSSVRLESVPANAAALRAATRTRTFLDLGAGQADYRAVVSTIESQDGKVVGVFEAALPRAPARATAADVAWTLFGAGLAVVVIGALASAALARTSLNPLRQVAARTRAVTHSSLGERIDYDGPDDEVGILVAAVNGMLGRLETAFGEQKRFVSDASHELRTPLAVISGHLDAAINPNIGEADREASLETVREELGRMERLVDELLMLARLDAGPGRTHQPLDLGIVVMEAVQRARALGPTSIEASCADEPWVSGDPDQLLQAVLNLTSNAVQHAGWDGTVTVSCFSRSGRACVRVQDDGPGIDPKDLPHVFDRFYRGRGTRSEAAGSGLGLAIAKRLVEVHGGEISVENIAAASGGGDIATGASFTITLPLIQPPPVRS